MTRRKGTTISESRTPPGPRSLSITLVRHAAVSWSINGRTVNEPDLNPLGISQAIQLGSQLQLIQYDRYLVSPRVRARQTARVAGIENSEIVPWLTEIEYPAKWEGTPAGISSHFFETLRGAPVAARWEAFDEAGESAEAYVSRTRDGAMSFLNDLGVHPEAADGLPLWQLPPRHQNLLLIGHVGSLTTFLGILLGLPPVPWEWERFVLGNCSMSKIVTCPVGDRYAFTLSELSSMEYLPSNLRSW